MENEPIDNRIQLTEPAEFKTNTARYALFVLFWVIVCLLFVNTQGFAGIIIIAIIALIPSTLKLLFHSMTIREHDIEYKVGWLRIRRIQIPFDKISSVDTDISILGRLLDYGIIMVQANNSNVNIRFKSINEPEKVKHLIEQGIVKGKETSTLNQPTTQIGVADEISKLQQLKDAGSITNEEFDAEKSRLLNR
jgi:membrane protein YdbS with pleckstrin-like domain